MEGTEATTTTEPTNAVEAQNAAEANSVEAERQMYAEAFREVVGGNDDSHESGETPDSPDTPREAASSDAGESGGASDSLPTEGESGFSEDEARIISRSSLDLEDVEAMSPERQRAFLAREGKKQAEADALPDKIRREQMREPDAEPDLDDEDGGDRTAEAQGESAGEIELTEEQRKEVKRVEYEVGPETAKFAERAIRAESRLEQLTEGLGRVDTASSIAIDAQIGAAMNVVAGEFPVLYDDHEAQDALEKAFYATWKEGGYGEKPGHPMFKAIACMRDAAKSTLSKKQRAEQAARATQPRRSSAPAPEAGSPTRGRSSDPAPEARSEEEIVRAEARRILGRTAS